MDAAHPEHPDRSEIEPEDLFGDVDLDDAEASLFRVLGDGPLRDDALLAALRADGAWGAVGELSDDEFAAAIDELATPGVWRTQMAMWFDLFGTLDGRVFTHRVTSEELAEDAIAALPDLSLLDWDVAPRSIPGGSGEITTDFDPTFIGFEGGRLRGPEGWLEGFASGDVIGLRLQGADGVTIERVDTSALPGPDDAVVQALATSFRDCFDRWADSGGDELGPATLDVLVEVPDAFRTPTLPLAELASVAGLERRGLEFGPSDRRWLSAPQKAFRLRADEMLAEVEWLATPLRAVVDVLVDWLDDPASPIPPEAVVTARTALETEGVAGMAGELFRGRPGSNRLAGFVAALGGPGNDLATASLNVLLGIEAELAGRFEEAEQQFRSAVERDPAQTDGVIGLGLLAADRGDVVESDRRFRAVGGPEAWLAAMANLVPPRSTGRNEPCPCGSGRKFKQCCLIAPQAPVEQRGPWYDLRLTRHLVNRDATAIDQFYLVLSAVLDPEDRIDHAIIGDLVGVATGTTASYLEAHADHLDEVDHTGLQAWRDAPVTIVGDATSGFTDLRHVVELGARPYVVWSLPIGERSRLELEGLLADDDAITSVPDWAFWYASTFDDD